MSLLDALAMDYKLFLRSIIKNILIFIIAIVLVLGFYFHSEFYKLGLEGVVVVGSIITFLVIKFATWINTHRFFQIYDGVLLFESEDVEKVKNGVIKGMVKKYRASRTIKKGNIIRAKLSLEDEKYFAELLITDVKIKKLKDITDEDAYICGYKSREEFMKKWKEFGGYVDENEDVRLIMFRTV